MCEGGGVLEKRRCVFLDIVSLHCTKAESTYVVPCVVIIYLRPDC